MARTCRTPINLHRRLQVFEWAACETRFPAWEHPRRPCRAPSRGRVNRLACMTRGRRVATFRTAPNCRVSWPLARKTCRPASQDVGFPASSVPASLVLTTPARRDGKAVRLDAAALPASLDGTPGTVVGWTPTRALGSARKAVRLNAAPGALGRREGSRRWTRLSQVAATSRRHAQGRWPAGNTSADSHRHGKDVSRCMPKAPQAIPAAGPSPAGLPQNPGKGTTPREPSGAPSRGRCRNARERPIRSKPRMPGTPECTGTRPGSASGDHNRHSVHPSFRRSFLRGADRMGDPPGPPRDAVDRGFTPRAITSSMAATVPSARGDPATRRSAEPRRRLPSISGAPARRRAAAPARHAGTRD